MDNTEEIEIKLKKNNNKNSIQSDQLQNHRLQS